MTNRKKPDFKKIANMKRANAIRISIFWVLVVILGLTYFAIVESNFKPKEVTISEVISGINDGKIAKVEGNGNDLYITTKDDSSKPTQKSYIQGGVASLLKNDRIDKNKQV